MAGIYSSPANQLKNILTRGSATTVNGSVLSLLMWIIFRIHWLCDHYFKWNTEACNSWYNEWIDIHVYSDHHQRQHETYHYYDHRYPISFIFFGYLCNIFDNSTSIFFLSFSPRLLDLHLVCSLGYINSVYLFRALIAAFYFFIIVELICSIFSQPQMNYFIIYSSYIFYKFTLA